MTQYRRRTFLAAAATASVAGCVTESDDGSQPNDQQMTDSPDTNTTDEMIDREAELERLPDRSPLSTALEDLYAAEDRQAYAESLELNYRDGRVRVEIMLEPDGSPPEQYLSDATSEYGDTLMAFVAIEDLIDLALDENVRLVSTPSQPQTHN